MIVDFLSINYVPWIQAITQNWTSGTLVFSNIFGNVLVYGKLWKLNLRKPTDIEQCVVNAEVLHGQFSKKSIVYIV